MGAIKFYTILPWGTIIMCATINFLQNLPQGTVIRAVLLLGSEEYWTPNEKTLSHALIWSMIYDVKQR